MEESGQAPATVEEWRAHVLEAERRGEPLLAFDRAERGLESHPDDRWLQHRAVLALARAGSTDEAERRFRAYDLAAVGDEDTAALAARIAKDRALGSSGDTRQAEARRAAALYEAVHELTGGYYSAVNAATLELLAGDDARARKLAARAQQLARAEREQSYYAVATQAEALLVQRELEAASVALGAAADRAEGDYAAVATTRRQLRLVCRLTGTSDSVLDALPNPEVVHYTGHRITPSGRFRPDAEEAVTAGVRRVVANRAIGFAYGSLASGADILWAEALLDRAVELHVILPFARDEFLDVSVAPAGARWVERFNRCLARATSVRLATEDGYLGDDVLFRYAAELGMGLAILRARALDARVLQLAVWDGDERPAGAGTAVDVSTWSRLGLPAERVELPAPAAPAPADVQADRAHSRRVVRALLFADAKGFSRLSDAQLPVFSEHVLGRLAEVLARHEEAVCYRNTWGDGVYLVVQDAVRAAAIALDLQAAVDDLDLEALGLPPTLALRIGGHLGPVYETVDPILGAPSFVGAHVSRTARIEPVTPEGSVYVSEPFAAALAIERGTTFTCDYVGHVPAAKDLGRLRMYRLRVGYSADR